MTDNVRDALNQAMVEVAESSLNGKNYGEALQCALTVLSVDRAHVRARGVLLETLLSFFADRAALEGLALGSTGEGHRQPLLVEIGVENLGRLATLERLGTFLLEASRGPRTFQAWRFEVPDGVQKRGLLMLAGAVSAGEVREEMRDVFGRALQAHGVGLVRALQAVRTSPADQAIVTDGFRRMWAFISAVAAEAAATSRGKGTSRVAAEVAPLQRREAYRHDDRIGISALQRGRTRQPGAGNRRTCVVCGEEKAVKGGKVCQVGHFTCYACTTGLLGRVRCARCQRALS